MSLHDNLAELHAELCDQVNALVTLEASNRVMTREKIKLTKELGVRVADGNEFTIEENGVKRQYIIQSVQFENFLNFDKLSNLQLTCKQVSPLTNDDPEVFSTSYLKDLASENKILPACESATALQERLGFPSMGQNFDVGTEFHYRLENNDAQRFEIAKIDPYNREIYLSS